MELSGLVSFLENRLTQSLPGAIAHDLMKPTLPGGLPIRVKHSEPHREGGVMILLYEEQGRVRFPLIQRPVYDGVHSGQIAFPGGKKEELDTDLIETAMRESMEEIGVNVSRMKVIGSLSKFFVAASNFEVLPVISYVDQPPVFTPDDREVSEIITPSLIDLVNETNRKTKKMEVGNGVTLEAPYFSLQQKVVWGATAMMLSEFTSILSEFESF
ncbi:MAG: CoA pyrophosphatase [Bacteroidota bacterium]